MNAFSSCPRENQLTGSVGWRRLILDSLRPSSLIFHIISSALILLTFPTRQALWRAAAGCVCRQGGFCVWAPCLTLLASSNLSEAPYFLIWKKFKNWNSRWFLNISFRQGLTSVLLQTLTNRGCFCTCTNHWAQLFQIQPNHPQSAWRLTSSYSPPYPNREQDALHKFPDSVADSPDSATQMSKKQFCFGIVLGSTPTRCSFIQLVHLSWPTRLLS